MTERPDAAHINPFFPDQMTIEAFMALSGLRIAVEEVGMNPNFPPDHRIQALRHFCYILWREGRPQEITIYASWDHSYQSQSTWVINNMADHLVFIDKLPDLVDYAAYCLKHRIYQPDMIQGQHERGTKLAKRLQMLLEDYYHTLLYEVKY